VAAQGFSTFFSPSVFNLSVPLTNRIADGTDISLQNPKHLVAQRSTCYSMHYMFAIKKSLYIYLKMVL